MSNTVVTVPAPQFGPLGTGWPPVAVVTPGGQPDPQCPRVVRSLLDNQLHLVSPAEVRAAMVVNYSHAWCGRRIAGGEPMLVSGRGGGFCFSCVAVATEAES